MGRNARWIVIVAAVVVLVVLFALLRPTGSEPRATLSPSTPTSSVSPSATPTTSPSASPEPTRTVIEVTVRGGNVQGPTQPRVRQGDRVRILVTADVSDHVHLHGYDLMADVSPGNPGRIDLVATAAGVFECELEDAGTLLFRLEIVP